MSSQGTSLSQATGCRGREKEGRSKNLVPEKAGKEEIVSKGSGPLDSSLFMRADDTWLLLRENVSFQYPGRFA